MTPDVTGDEADGELTGLAPPAEAAAHPAHPVAVLVHADAESPRPLAAHDQVGPNGATGGHLLVHPGAEQPSSPERHVEPCDRTCGAVTVDRRDLRSEPALGIEDL